MRHSRPRPAHRGFTLIEILTATAVMSVIVAMVLTVVTMVMNTWTNSSDKLAMSTQARVVLDLVAQDLQGAIFRRTGLAANSTDASNPQWFALELERSERTDSRPQSRLMFFASTTQREDEVMQAGAAVPVYGDVCAIEYRVLFEPIFPNNKAGAKAFVLHRAVANAKSTLNGFNANRTEPAERMLGSINLKEMWNKIDDKGTGSETVDGLTVYGGTAPETAIAYNVAQFKVIYYRQSRDLPTPNFNESLPGAIDPRSGLPATEYGPQPLLNSKDPNNPRNVYYGGVNDNIFNADGLGRDVEAYSTLPAYADITLTLISEEGAVLYDRQKGEVGDWDLFLTTYGQSFTQRVYFSNRPQ